MSPEHICTELGVAGLVQSGQEEAQACAGYPKRAKMANFVGMPPFGGNDEERSGPHVSEGCHESRCTV